MRASSHPTPLSTSRRRGRGISLRATHPLGLDLLLGLAFIFSSGLEQVTCIINESSSLSSSTHSNISAPNLTTINDNHISEPASNRGGGRESPPGSRPSLPGSLWSSNTFGQRLGCGRPPRVDFAHSNLNTSKGDVFSLGSRAHYSCHNGFRRTSGSETLVCRQSSTSPSGGSWEGPPVVCESVNCGDPGFVVNARKIGFVFTYQSNVTFECDHGFRTVGTPFLICRANGRWNRERPFCERIECPDLGRIKDGKPIVYKDQLRRVGSEAEFGCLSNFRLKTSDPLGKKVCLPDGTWSGSPISRITCERIYCERPVQPHSGLIIKGPKKTKYSQFEILIFHCHTNVVVTTKCSADGSWTRDPPHCPQTSASCPALGDFAHGSYLIDRPHDSADYALPIGTKVKFECHEDFRREGSMTIVCQPSYVWSAAAPVCALKANAMTNPASSSASSTLSHLAILLISISVVLLLILATLFGFYFRWWQKKQQRKRWQRYFGTYATRQSKKNITVGSNQEMKLYRQSKGSPVPVTDL